MAQTEDTELRDLVIEALEKNGSLAKIRALLRANIFLTFEDDCKNTKQNSNLEDVLKIPEGILSLSIVHEFLEFCNLKNTLFVYMAESRQGKKYDFDNKKKIIEMLSLNKEVFREPVLITLLKSYSQNKHIEENYKSKINKDTENCTYIVEDSQSSATSNSQSDSSSDEKNKLHLRLQLNNSDTDTSNDSGRDKVSSEYYPSQHIKKYNTENKSDFQHSNEQINTKEDKNGNMNQIEHSTTYQNMINLKVGSSSSDSTSYVELKPFNALDEKLLNTSGLPLNDIKVPQIVLNEPSTKNETVKTATLNSASPDSSKDDSNGIVSEGKSPRQKDKSDVDTAEYSFDFSSSPSRKHVDNLKNNVIKRNVKNIQDNNKSSNKDSSSDSSHQSSQGSVSISDVADLISEKSLSVGNRTNHDQALERSRLSSYNYSRKRSDRYRNKVLSDDSGDFTESPIASLSNLSLDIHSE